MPKRNIVSIIILDFLKAKKVIQSVESILKQKTNYSIEIIIVDNSTNPKNAKTLEQLKKHKNIKIIINKKNEGYTRGNNKGANLAKGEFIAIANPDIIWKHQDTLEKLVCYLKQNPDIGILAPKQINPDGSTAMTARAFPNIFTQIIRRTFLKNLPGLKKLVAHDEMRHLDNTKTQDVDWLQSSFIIMKKDFWEKCGGFDKTYFLFMSDAELCWQSWKKKKRVTYYPKAKVHADGIRCSEGGFKAFFKRWVLRQHFKDSMKYTWKHFFEKCPRKT